jgi:hypothetical protein
MTAAIADTMHRLAKLALDSGEATDPGEAMRIFSQYRLRIHLGEGWADSLAGQACFVTALNTAARAFLGGVEVVGNLNCILQVPLFRGRRASDIVAVLGGTVAAPGNGNIPTVVLGRWTQMHTPEFCVQLQWNAWQAWLTPAAVGTYPYCENDNPLAGVAAAALGINEAFLYIRGDSPIAGHRVVGLSLWDPLAIDNWSQPNRQGAALEFLPASLWLVGLGHLGQAYAWTLGMLPYAPDSRPHVVLQDFDRAAESNLSTCLLLAPGDIGGKKVRLVAQQLEAAGFTTSLVERRFTAGQQVTPDEPTTVLFGVDNVTARRDIDTAGFEMAIEAGLGSGYRDFRNIRLHTFPGGKRASEVWSASDAAQAPVELNPVYQKLAAAANDLCGMTQLASRAVATPFVGVFAAALVAAEVVRPLHGGSTLTSFDVSLRDLRYRTGASSSTERAMRTAFTRVQFATG